MKIGITGATGLIRGSLLKALDSQNLKIRALTRETNSKWDLNGDIEWHFGDLTFPAVCDKFIDGLDILFHFAYSGTPISSNIDIRSDCLKNLTPSLNLIESLRKKKAPTKIIFASSGGGLYIDTLGNKEPFREDSLLLPSTSYGVSKLALEGYFRLLTAMSAHTCLSLRISNPYGVLLPPGSRQGLVGVAITRAINGNEIEVFGSPNNVRDYIHIDDLMNALILSMYINLGSSNSFEVLNIGSGVGLSVAEVLKKIETLIGKPLKKRNISIEMSELLPQWSILNISKAKRALNWVPKISFESGLRKMVENLKPII